MMSVTSGFFNSSNGDRKYNAEQMSAIFDGIINDGVFANIGSALAVKSDSRNVVTVGLGRAWFNSTWINNDAILSISMDDAEVLRDRYDAIVIEIDRTNSVRNATIKKIKGTPASSNPKKPEMVNVEDVHQHPLAYIYRAAGSTTITQSDIENRIGTSDCPYITGVLEVVNIDNLISQWSDQWSTWTSEEQSNFYSWFDQLKYVLTGDVAAKMLNEIFITNEEVAKIKDAISVTFLTTGWSNAHPYEQTVVVSGVTPEDIPTVGIIYPTGCTRDQQKAINKAASYIYEVETITNAVTVRCTKQPEISIQLSLKGITGKKSQLQRYVRDSDGNLILDSAVAAVKDSEYE